MHSIRVLVLPAFVEAPDFPGELAPWLDHLSDPTVRSVEGIPEPVRIDDRGLAVVPTGIGKTDAAATVATLLAGDAVDLSSAYVLSAGIAGGHPHRTTIGAVHLAETIVDWDYKQRWDPADTAERSSAPVALAPFRPYDLVYPVDVSLRAAAHGLIESVALSDSEAALAQRARYPETPTTPFIGGGTNVCGDEWWHGAGMAAEVERLLEDYGVDPYVVTESEDAATARVLQRFHRLDRYLSVRAVSNYDRPATGEDVRASAAEGGGGGEVAVENVFRVASTIADGIIENWSTWADGPPDSPDVPGSLDQ